MTRVDGLAPTHFRSVTHDGAPLWADPAGGDVTLRALGRPRG